MIPRGLRLGSQACRRTVCLGSRLSYSSAPLGSHMGGPYLAHSDGRSRTLSLRCLPRAGWRWDRARDRSDTAHPRRTSATRPGSRSVSTTPLFRHRACAAGATAHPWWAALRTQLHPPSGQPAAGPPALPFETSDDLGDRGHRSGLGGLQSSLAVFPPECSCSGTEPEGTGPGRASAATTSWERKGSSNLLDLPSPERALFTLAPPSFLQIRDGDTGLTVTGSAFPYSEKPKTVSALIGHAQARQAPTGVRTRLQRSTASRPGFAGARSALSAAGPDPSRKPLLRVAGARPLAGEHCGAAAGALRPAFPRCTTQACAASPSPPPSLLSTPSPPSPPWRFAGLEIALGRGSRDGAMLFGRLGPYGPTAWRGEAPCRSARSAALLLAGRSNFFSFFLGAQSSRVASEPPPNLFLGSLPLRLAFGLFVLDYRVCIPVRALLILYDASGNASPSDSTTPTLDSRSALAIAWMRAAHLSEILLLLRSGSSSRRPPCLRSGNRPDLAMLLLPGRVALAGHPSLAMPLLRAKQDRALGPRRRGALSLR